MALIVSRCGSKMQACYRGSGGDMGGLGMMSDAERAYQEEKNAGAGHPHHTRDYLSLQLQ